MRACPHKAIAFANGAAYVEPTACTGCGICAGVCDGFALAGEGVEALHARLRRLAVAGETAVLTCPRFLPEGFSPAENVVKVPCLAALSPEFWTLCLAEGLPLAVACDLAACESCSRAGAVAETLYSRAIELAQERTDGEVAFLDAVPAAGTSTGGGLLEALARAAGAEGENGEVGRREALSGLKQQVEDVASGAYRRRSSEALQDHCERQDSLRTRASMPAGATGAPEANPYAPGGVTKRVVHPRRAMLLPAPARLPELAASIPLALSATDAALCEGALACAAVCPTGARHPSPADGALAFDPLCCIGCGLCVDACKTGAASVEATCAESLLEVLPLPEQPDDQEEPHA